MRQRKQGVSVLVGLTVVLLASAGCDNRAGGPRITMDPPPPTWPQIKVVNVGHEANLGRVQ